MEVAVGLLIHLAVQADVEHPDGALEGRHRPAQGRAIADLRVGEAKVVHGKGMVEGVAGTGEHFEGQVEGLHRLREAVEPGERPSPSMLQEGPLVRHLLRVRQLQGLLIGRERPLRSTARLGGAVRLPQVVEDGDVLPDEGPSLEGPEGLLVSRHGLLRPPHLAEGEPKVVQGAGTLGPMGGVGQTFGRIPERPRGILLLPQLPQDDAQGVTRTGVLDRVLARAEQ